MYRMTVKHTIEAAHRLLHPNSPAKCRNIHGHRWAVELTLAGNALDERGMLVEFGQLKQAWKGWLDNHLDHVLILHEKDPLRNAILSVEPTHRIYQLAGEPTAEKVAQLLYNQAQKILEDIPGVWVEKVQVAETENNIVECLGTAVVEFGNPARASAEIPIAPGNLIEQLQRTPVER